MGSEIFVILLVVLVIIFAARAIQIVPQGFEYTVERFGRYVRTLHPGLNLLTPLVEQVGHRIDVREQMLDVNQQEVITKDNAVVKADGLLFYQVVDAAKASYNVNDLKRSLNNLAQTNLRTVMGSMELDELLSKRDDINHRLLAVIDAAAFDPWGVKVTRVEIKDIQPPQDLIDSLQRQINAERNKRAAILVAEGEREAAIKKAQGLREATVLQAEAERQAAFLAAEARERMAQAESKAISTVSSAITVGGMGAANYFIATKYVDSLKEIASAPNEKLVFMPLEAGNVIGALGGIQELTKFMLPKKDG